MVGPVEMAIWQQDSRRQNDAIHGDCKSQQEFGSGPDAESSALGGYGQIQ
jgi:hypothetical protein